MDKATSTKSNVSYVSPLPPVARRAVINKRGREKKERKNENIKE